MVVLGLRNLLPYNFQAIQNPYLEIETGNEHGGKPEITITKTSKKPSPNNANFLERFIIDAKLPINPIFAQPILLRVIDTRLGIKYLSTHYIFFIVLFYISFLSIFYFHFSFFIFHFSFFIFIVTQAGTQSR
jgi:hypothetical protein